MSKTAVKEVSLEQLLEKWQRILRLQDWRIQVNYARVWDFARDGRIGEIGINLSCKIADISLLDPLDHENPAFLYPVDTEATLVHELLHCHFAPFDVYPDDPMDIAQEQAIECIATALIAADRGK